MEGEVDVLDTRNSFGHGVNLRHLNHEDGRLPSTAAALLCDLASYETIS